MTAEIVNEGRLFTLKLRRNAEARAAALATLWRRPDGLWQARVGGKIRGCTVTGSRRSVEIAIDDHYNAVMLTFVTRKR